MNEDIVIKISEKKNEPKWLLDFRLNAYKRWLRMEDPDWAKLKIDKIDYNQNSNIEKSNYAFLMEWHEYLSPKALNMLLENDIIVKAATKRFKLNGKEYDYGTILIPVQNNKHIDLNELLNRVSKECLVEINSVKTGYADGPDLGLSLIHI